MTLRLKFFKKCFLCLLILIVSTMLILRALGFVSNRTVLVAFLSIELPLVLLFVSLACIELYRLRKARGLRGQDFLTAIEEELPLLRIAVMEGRTLFALVELLRGRRNGVDSTTRGFNYAKGTLAIPITLGIATVIEAGAIHMLIPWQWLRILLLIASVYALILIAGVFAARIVNPHLVSPQTLLLKWGHRTVLETPLDNIVKIRQISNHQHMQPAVDGALLVLTSFTSTNLRITLSEPAAAYPPVSKKQLPKDFSALELDIYVANPRDFVRFVNTFAKQ